MNVVNVEKPLKQSLTSLYVGKPTQERNPMVVMNVGKPSVGTTISFHIRELIQGETLCMQ